jgi:hypothetical protein
MGTRSGNAPLNVAVLTPAGTVLADATLIRTKSPALIAATGNGTVGIRLPKAAAGKVYHIKNRAAAATLNVWPYDTGDAINAIGAGSAMAMAAVTAAVFVAVDSTTWYTIPLLPS